jgi:hypothetical protein
MKMPLPVLRVPLILLTVAGAALTASATMVTTLPASLAAPLGSSTKPGFLVRTVQASTNAGPVLNSYQRAYRQLNGTLIGTNSLVATNAAFAGTNADGSFTVPIINFEKNAQQINITVPDPNNPGTMYISASLDGSSYPQPNPFPGLDVIDPSSGNYGGQEGLVDNFAVEVVTYLTLQAGSNVFGISSGADRTDVNDDDGFFAFTAPSPYDFFGTQISAAEKNTTSAFGGDQHLETQLILIAPVAGIYPFRIIYWQTSHGANLQLYSIDESGIIHFVNDSNDPSSIAAYTDTTSVPANAPYCAEVSPTPGSAGNPPTAPVTALLIDRAKTVTLGTVALSLNGVPATITKAQSGGRTTVSYSPPALRTDPNNAIKLTYADNGSVSHTNSWAFTISVTGGNAATVAGQWDFNYGDLRATIGNPLQYYDSTFDGPTGSASDKTQFGTTTSFGIPNINGQIARVMRVPGALDLRYGYAMHHGISPNGGGTLVNQYTLIMDVFVATTGPGAAALWRVKDPSSDGDLFWQGNNFGQGGGGYNGKGTFTPGAWHRVIAAYDEAANTPVVTKYVDGVKQDDWTANQGLDNSRRAMGPVAWLFSDGTTGADERREMWVKSIQIRAGKLTDAQCALLGGPDAQGIPVNLPNSNVAGQWDFEFGDLSASIGKPLEYYDPTFDGPTGSAANKTTFGTCSALGVATINGVDANVMQVPGDLDLHYGYAMTHTIPPNGGGTLVNQYTLIMDVMIANSGPGAAALWRVKDPSSDGDLFWQGNNFGQGGGGYNGKGTFTPSVWHRVVAAYDEAAATPVVTKYVDGIKQDDWTANQGLDNTRRAMGPVAWLFSDGTTGADERRQFWVKSVQIRAGKLSDAQIVALGVPDGKGIPVATPGTSVAGQWDFENGDLSATIGQALQYYDPTFDGPTGSAADKTTFGTCSALGVDPINGVDAKVMQVPGDLDLHYGYAMAHGIAPNGGGTLVNQYTLLMDVFVATTGPGAAAIWRVKDPASDGDLFWQGNNFGQGGGGYNGTGAFTPGAWHRVVAAYDEAGSPPVVTKFVDAIFQDDWTANQGLDNTRRAMGPIAWLFSDGTTGADERRQMWVKSIQIRSSKMSNADIIALGAPNGLGIPAVSPPSVPSITMLPNLGGKILLVWPVGVTGAVLHQASSLEGPWSPVSGVQNNSVELTVGAGPQYFVLRK